MSRNRFEGINKECFLMESRFTLLSYYLFHICDILCPSRPVTTESIRFQTFLIGAVFVVIVNIENVFLIELDKYEKCSFLSP